MGWYSRPMIYDAAFPTRSRASNIGLQAEYDTLVRSTGSTVSPCPSCLPSLIPEITRSKCDTCNSPALTVMILRPKRGHSPSKAGYPLMPYG